MFLSVPRGCVSSNPIIISAAVAIQIELKENAKNIVRSLKLKKKKEARDQNKTLQEDYEWFNSIKKYFNNLQKEIQNFSSCMSCL